MPVDGQIVTDDEFHTLDDEGLTLDGIGTSRRRRRRNGAETVRLGFTSRLGDGRNPHVEKANQ